MWERPENQNIDKALDSYLMELGELLKKTGINPLIQGGILYSGKDNCDENCTGDHCDYCDANSEKYEMITESPSVQKQVGIVEKCIKDNYVSGGGIYTRITGGYIEYLRYISGSVYGNVYIFLRLKYTPSERKVFGRNSNTWGINTDVPTLANYIALQYLTDVSLPKMPNMAPSYAEDQLMLLAGKKFLENLLHDYVSPKHNGFIGDLNIVSSLAYESQANVGNIVLLHKDFLVYPAGGTLQVDSSHNGAVNLLSPRTIRLGIRFAEPVSMSNHKRVRKLFEIATGDTYLVGDGVYIYGIASKKMLEDQTVDRYMLISIQGPLRWELYEIRSAQFKERMLRVIYDSTGFKIKKKSTYKLDICNKLDSINKNSMSGVEDVQSNPCDRCVYRESCRATTVSGSEDNADVANRLTDIIKEAAGQKHGTTIVFSRFARQEVQRLKKTCFQIEDVQLSSNSGLIKPITAIDGAIMCDFEGNCHAIGVILDGMTISGMETGSVTTTGMGKRIEEDISRGARYNSAIRYKNANPCSIICIVSEDGDVNII